MIQSVNGFPEALERLEHLHAWAKGKTLDEQRATSDTPPIPLLLSPCPHVRAYLDALTRRIQPAISAFERAAAATPGSQHTATSNGDGTTRIQLTVPLTTHEAFAAVGTGLVIHERTRHVIEHNERLMADNYPPPGWDAVRWRALAVAVGMAEADPCTREGQEQIVVAAMAAVHRQRLTVAPTPTSETAISPPLPVPVPMPGEGKQQPDTGTPAEQPKGQGVAAVDELLPTLLSAGDIAKRIGENRSSVTTFLTRFAETNRNCRVEVQNPQANSPKYLYCTAEVWPAIQSWLSARAGG